MIPDKLFRANINPVSGYSIATRFMDKYPMSLGDVFYGTPTDMTAYHIPTLPINNLIRQLESIRNLIGFTDCKLELSLYSVLSRINVFCVTEDDCGKEHHVTNVFNNQTITTKVPNPLPMDSSIATECLGCYNPETSVIYIWVDRISNLPLNRLLFQKVLLHEFIHFCFDAIRAIKSNLKKRSMDEEKVDNTLVLLCYSNTSNNEIDTAQFYQIRSFIASQPDGYKDAIELYNNDWMDIRHALVDLLCY